MCHITLYIYIYIYIYFFLQNGEDSRWRVWYQQGPPCQIFIITPLIEKFLHCKVGVDESLYFAMDLCYLRSDLSSIVSTGYHNIFFKLVLLYNKRWGSPIDRRPFSMQLHQRAISTNLLTLLLFSLTE